VEQSRQGLHFVVANDANHDFDLVQEAWMGGVMVAILHREGYGDEMRWRVNFYAPYRQDTPYSKVIVESSCELGWEDFQCIAQSFADFQKRMMEIVNREASE
jgi:hypothetical protein